tara:strand:- start:2440 stop:2715 length:276 start_codon:yes stop_codon:yes gene_type:complete
MKNLLNKLLFLGAILSLALVLSGATREGFECEIKNYPDIYEDELVKGSKLDAGKMYQFSDALKEDEVKNVVEPGFNCRRVGFFCSNVTNVY